MTFDFYKRAVLVVNDNGIVVDTPVYIKFRTEERSRPVIK